MVVEAGEAFSVQVVQVQSYFGCDFMKVTKYVLCEKK